MYGGISNFDAGKFYHDVIVISDFAKKDFDFFIRFMFGLQDDVKGSYDYEQVFRHTFNWQNGKAKDYLYNDNRVLIRLHVLLNFIAFDSYPVHALLNCFLSFTGIFFIYKGFKQWFAGQEAAVLLILCFFPSLWFYTGALLKEGIAIFVLGCLLYQLKKMIFDAFSVPSLIWLLFLLYLCDLIKPYLLASGAICFALFFIIYKWNYIRRKITVYFSVFIVLVITVNFFSLATKKRSLWDAAFQQRHQFTAVSKGGTFLSDTSRFVRVANDTSLLKRVAGTKKNVFTIKKDAPFMYWLTEGQKDTLYCEANQDTTTHFDLAFIIPESRSNIPVSNTSTFYLARSAFYYTLFYPLFFNANGPLQLLASIENLVILMALFIIIAGLIQNKKEKFITLVLVIFALSMCGLIGLTTPNSGAIFRYRAPTIIFLLMAALYYWKSLFGPLIKKP